jgi:hypothetical protein
MKKCFCLMVVITMVFVSCKKEFKPQTVDQIVTQMKADNDMKELYTSSKGWVIMTSIDVKKRRFDSAATVSYLQNFRSTEHARLQKMAQNIKSRYNLDMYSVEEVKAMIATTFRSFIVVESGKVRKISEGARFEDPTQPTDISFSPIPKDCYKWLIEDISDCDEEMVIDTGLALLGLFAGPATYFIAQGAAFIRHSRCVDKAHEEYQKCKATTELVDPNSIDLGAGTIQIFNPVDPSDFVIIYDGY